jgi:hypothetical protein
MNGLLRHALMFFDQSRNPALDARAGEDLAVLQAHTADTG